MFYFAVTMVSNIHTSVKMKRSSKAGVCLLIYQGTVNNLQSSDTSDTNVKDKNQVFEAVTQI